MRAGDTSLVTFLTKHPLRYLWGLAADIGIFVYTLVLGPLASIAVLVTRSGKPVDVLGRLWCRLIVRTCGIKIDVEGLDRVRPGRSYVIISNHLSNFDIWCTLAALPLPIRFVAKKELLRVPIFGQALALSDHIVIDRRNPEEAIKAINAAAARSEDGICILFYAEGTRSPDGAVHAFKKGGVVLALRTGLPIVPLTVSGTRRFLPKGCVVIRPGGQVRLVMGAPIETAGMSLDDRNDLNARVRDAILANFSPGTSDRA